MQKSADAFRTISEVADQLDVPQHVLRFWETRFPQVRPLKRAGGRRYYRPGDVDLLTSIRRLLYDRGYTIKGVQRLLKERGQRGLRDDDSIAGLDGVDLDDIATGEGIAPASAQRCENGANEMLGVSLESRSASENLEPSVVANGLGSPSGQDHVALRDALAVIEDCERILNALRRPV